ncbi:hypothetical protein [Paracoccus fistulariae]|uniref:Uncharacterized protein n=1 Tax=Paracoccus fistulariae TaxID=658446 RepID=A0ABY7SMM5_9RHOB|nr:hypothetical protein [Paracoccus fistulariae]MDB6180177.1 hypothetical protein [Paracoccus fistulariae]WCR08263.1 hypothetical protein JHX87_05460 [Paracoccus fistulariae]
MRNLLIPALLALLAALPASANSPRMPVLNCVFATECLDNECADSGYSAQLRLRNARPVDSQMTLISAEFEDASETVPLQGMILSGNKRLFNTESATGTRLLTISPDGTARYTTHIAEPLMAMTYLGQCEEDR